MQFHNLVTLTFQPFLHHGTRLDQPQDRGAFEIDASFSPARLYAASKASLQTLVHMFYHRHGFETYYIFLLPILVQLGFDSIERLRTPEAQQEHFPPIMKATRATLILCAKGLRDQGRNFFLSELVFRILQDKMNPVDLKLLKDWARIKGEDKREKSMLEHVHSEYSVNVKSISSILLTDVSIACCSPWVTSSSLTTLPNQLRKIERRGRGEASYSHRRDKIR